VKLVVDAMGSDRRPVPDVQGAADAAREFDTEILLVGPEARLRPELSKYPGAAERVRIVNASQEIEMREHPALAVKSKKDSSIVVGIELVKRGEADALISMGNTGAVLTAAVLHLQRIRGILRPALATVYPTPRGPALILDIGANTDCKPEWLEQFAIMGDLYARTVLGIERPRVALLSIGEEETRGSQAVQAAHARLRARASVSDLNFIGNVEGKDIPERAADVVVCDGFDGNIVIKLSEGLSKMLVELIEQEIRRGPLTTLGGALALPAFRRVRRILDYAEYGGGPLLGVNGIVIIGHGRSNALAVKNAIRVARQAVETNLLGGIRNGIAAQAL
jgi:glycerol-3-phosphate acyltransferase PlsX